MKNIISEHYANIKKLSRLKKRYKDISEKIEEVAESMIGAHIILNSNIAAQQYSDDIQAQGGKPCSTMDREIEAIYSQREKYLVNLKKEKAYLYNDILELESKISALENDMLCLEESEIQLLEARFKYNKAVRVVAREMFFGVESTTYNKIKEVLEKIKSNKNLEKI